MIFLVVQRILLFLEDGIADLNASLGRSFRK